LLDDSRWYFHDVSEFPAPPAFSSKKKIYPSGGDGFMIQEKSAGRPSNAPPVSKGPPPRGGAPPPGGAPPRPGAPPPPRPGGAPPPRPY